MRALVTVTAHHAGTVCRDEDVFGENLDVGHTGEDGLKDLLDTLGAGFGEGVVVDIVGRDDFIEARHVVARYDLGEEVAKFDQIS